MLDKQLADFIEQGLALHIATRDQHLRPNGARASAIKVDEGGAVLVAYVPAVSAPRLLEDLRTNGQVALVCVWPPDDRGYQFKGTFVDAHDADADEEQFVRQQWERFRTMLETVGLPRVASDGWVTTPSVAIRIRVQTVFDQTPGPGAGARVR